jgi:molecular chaperone DnaK
MLIRVLQGEREMARDNWELGQLKVEFTPGPKSSARVGVQFEIDQNGILRVLARDTETGTDRVLEIQSAAVDVDDTRVERMIAESVDFAFDDMRERVWTESEQKAKELLDAVGKALDQADGMLDSAEQGSIGTAANDVKVALESNDAVRLKAAVAALDAATESLAARIVERAIEESLARKGVL